MAELYQKPIERAVHDYGPEILGTYDAWMRQMLAAEVARLEGRPSIRPEPPGFKILGGRVTEASIDCGLGLLVATAGGLFAVLLALIARLTGRYARRLNLPDMTLPGTGAHHGEESGRAEVREVGPAA